MKSCSCSFVLVLGILRIEQEHESTSTKVRPWIDLQLPEDFGAFNRIGALEPQRGDGSGS